MENRIKEHQLDLFSDRILITFGSASPIQAIFDAAYQQLQRLPRPG